MNKKKGVKDVVIRPAKDKSKTMRLNHFLSNYSKEISIGGRLLSMLKMWLSFS